jgi:hypothetical protein
MALAPATANPAQERKAQVRSRKPRKITFSVYPRSGLLNNAETFPTVARLSQHGVKTVNVMRRLFAGLAITIILASLVSPLAVALGTSSTPACCLPSGKHHCSQHSKGLGFKSKGEQCPYSSEIVISGFQGLEAPKFALTAPLATSKVGLGAVSNHSRIVFRELPARGPPSLSL